MPLGCAALVEQTEATVVAVRPNHDDASRRSSGQPDARSPGAAAKARRTLRIDRRRPGSARRLGGELLERLSTRDPLGRGRDRNPRAPLRHRRQSGDARDRAASAGAHHQPARRRPDRSEAFPPASLRGVRPRRLRASRRGAPRCAALAPGGGRQVPLPHRLLRNRQELAPACLAGAGARQDRSARQNRGGAEL